MLRGRARTDGSAGLVRRRGRPPKLSERQARQAGDWLLAGWTQQAIADRFGVARSVISQLRARLGPAPVQDELPEPAERATEQPTEEAVEEAGLEAVPGGPAVAERAGAPAVFAGSARITTGTLSCRYAGAMLLHAYLDRVGAEAIFKTVTGGPARRFDDLAVLSSAALGFALGIDTIEGAKHLRREQAGAALGLETVPELKTLRTRLAALADGTDPLQVQRAFAAAMLAADPAADPVYFVDDHFVPYAGARPVAKGWNTKRRHAGPGPVEPQQHRDVRADHRPQLGQHPGQGRAEPGRLTGPEHHGPAAGIDQQRVVPAGPRVAAFGVPALGDRPGAGVGHEVVIDEVHAVPGRVRSQHRGGERALHLQRVGAVGQRGQPGP